MPHAPTLPQGVLDSIAKQVGERLSATSLAPITPGASGPPSGGLSLGESFPVWMLGLDATTRPAEDFSRLATNTGDWHHQIHDPSGEHLMCRSTANGPNPEDWQVISLTRSSDLAKKIDQTIDWIDANVPGEPVTRMLKVPSYYLVAFWFHSVEDDQIVLVDMPKRFTKLQYQHIYPAREFLELLAQERHAQGVPQP